MIRLSGTADFSWSRFRTQDVEAPNPRYDEWPAVPTPTYPGYPAGYPASVGAWSQIGGLFFPEAAEQLDDLARRASRSRLWAGIHYPIDFEAALSMDRQIVRLAAMRVMEEHALPTSLTPSPE